MKYFYKPIIIFLCLISGSLVVVAQHQVANLNGSNMMWNGWPGSFISPIFMITFIVFVILGVAYFIRWLGRGSNRDGSKSSEKQERFDILKEKYTSGSIDEDEFIERQQLLREK